MMSCATFSGLLIIAIAITLVLLYMNENKKSSQPPEKSKRDEDIEELVNKVNDLLKGK